LIKFSFKFWAAAGAGGSAATRRLVVDGARDGDGANADALEIKRREDRRDALENFILLVLY